MITKRKREKKNDVVIPIPGVEPGPPGWKPGILTARPYGNYMDWAPQINVFEYNCWWEVQYCFFNVKAAQQFSKASPINHTELSEAKVSNRDESNTKSSQARPAQQKSYNGQTLPVLETNQAKYFRQKVEMSVVSNIFLVLSEVSYIFGRLSKPPFWGARIRRAYTRIEICLSKSVGLIN